jgi:hypothetical protein
MAPAFLATNITTSVIPLRNVDTPLPDDEVILIVTQKDCRD